MGYAAKLGGSSSGVKIINSSTSRNMQDTAVIQLYFRPTIFIYYNFRIDNSFIHCTFYDSINYPNNQFNGQAMNPIPSTTVNQINVIYDDRVVLNPASYGINRSDYLAIKI